MTATRMPTAIVGAITLTAALTLLGAFNVISFAAEGDIRHPPGFVSLLLAVFGAYALVGVWRRWVSGQAMAVGVGAVLAGAGLYLATSSDLATRLLDYDDLGYLLLVAGAGLVALVVVPRSAREWFQG